MAKEGEREEEVVWLLRHKVRRRILIAVGDAGRISATALRDGLGISTGSLYYNLRQLEKLIQQDAKRNYMLTEEGQRIYRVLKERGDISADMLRSSRGRFESTLSSIFFPIWLVGPILDRVQIALPMGLVSILLLSALFINSKYVLILLHIYHRSSFSLTEYASTLGLTILATYAYMTLTSYIYEKTSWDKREEGKGIDLAKLLVELATSRGQGLKLLSAIMLGLLPMSIYPAAAFVDRVLGGESWAINDTLPAALLPNVFLVIAQISSFVLLTAGLSYVKRLRWHISAVISFSLIYISIVVQYIVVQL